MRNPIACVSCRSAKQKCIHDDGPPCERCRQGGRADRCEFPQPGTSAAHRKPKRPRACDDTPGAGQDSPGTPAQRPASASGWAPRRFDVPTGTRPTDAAGATPAPTASCLSLEHVDPFDLLTDEVKNAYLRCAYKWSFHHTPTLLRRIRDRTLEPWLAWAMLALAIRFVNNAPPPFRTQTEASNAFAAHARQILQSDLETPSISRVQALLMLTGHDWGAGNGRRAWIYLGMAIRLVEVMGLTQELSGPRNRRPTHDEFIDAEVRRRTAWTCFLMDSLLSGGKGRRRSLAAADMAVQLPCEREPFVFGEPVCTEQLDRTIRMPPVSLPVGELGLIGYTMRAANIWGKVARWACSDDLKTELPWSPASQLQHLVHHLEGWKSSLPHRLQYDLFTLHSHNAIEQGQAYCYMHSIYFMSYMFLHRAYLPVLGSQANGSDETPNASSEHQDTWRAWQKTSRTQLFKDAAVVLEMLEEMRTFGVYFLRGLVPWIGFSIYTAVGVMLYSFYLPSSDDDPLWREKSRTCVIQGCDFLKEMKMHWPMAETWFETIKRMQAYYHSLSLAAPPSPAERQALRRAMVDYGALQPSPVQQPAEPTDVSLPPAPSTSTSTTPFPAVNLSPSTTNPPPPPHPTALTPAASTLSYQEANDTSMPDADDVFGLGAFDFTSAEFEELVLGATQEFWASFPGEVGVGV